MIKWHHSLNSHALSVYGLLESLSAFALAATASRRKLEHSLALEEGMLLARQLSLRAILEYAPVQADEDSEESQ